MKKIVKVTNVYTLQELNIKGYEKVIENESNNYLEHQASFEYSELLESIKTFCDKFYTKLRNWSIGAYSYSFIDINTESYFSLSNIDRNDLVKELNDMLKTGDGFTNLTGTYTDGYIASYFEDNKISKVNYNNIHKHIEKALNFAVKALVNDIENNSEDVEMIIDNLEANECNQFTIDGYAYN